MSVRSLSWAAAALLATATVARAAPPELRPLCADRPGKATPPCILDSGHLQLETGLFEASRQSAAGIRDDVDAYGAFELRYGLTRRAEVELGWTPWIIEKTRDASGAARRSGVSDLTLGFRAALTDPDAAGIAVSLRPFLTAPTATHRMGAGGWEGGVLLPLSLTVRGWTLGASPELDVARDAAGGATHLAWSGAVAASRGVGPLTLGAELWGAVDDDPARRTTQVTFDLTAAWTPTATPDLQLDAGANFGLSRDAPDVDVYIGLSHRF